MEPYKTRILSILRLFEIMDGSLQNFTPSRLVVVLSLFDSV